MKVAFLGIGLMGFPMASRLLTAGLELTAWSRAASKAQALTVAGARVASSPREAVSQADVTILMLENDAAVEEVLLADVTLSALRPTSIVIDMSSIRPDRARLHAQRLFERNVRYLDAPVSGGVDGAEKGTLAIMAGGAVEDIESLEAIWRALGRVTHVGPHGCGQLAKVANQMIVGLTIAAVAEALYLIEQRGGDPVKSIAAMSGGFADSPILKLHGMRMSSRDFQKRASITVQTKDLNNALAIAGGMNLPMTVCGHALFQQASLSGFEDMDHSGVWCEIERTNGLVAGAGRSS